MQLIDLSYHSLSLLVNYLICYQGKCLKHAIICCLSHVVKLHGHVKYVLNSYILAAQLCIDSSRNKHQLRTLTGSVMDSNHFWHFSSVFKEREREKKYCCSLAGIFWKMLCTFGFALPLLHPPWPSPTAFEEGVLSSVDLAWVLAHLCWAFGVTLVTEGLSCTWKDEFATEKVCREITCPTVSQVI